MNEELQYRLEKWFDGEAGPVEAREMEALLEKDPEARTFLKELGRTRDALRNSHATRRTPEWSVLKAELERAPRETSPKKMAFPMLAGLAALIVLAGMAVWLPFRNAGQVSADPEILLVNRVEAVETDLEGVTPVVYLDQPSGWTVVWVLEFEPSGEI